MPVPVLESFVSPVRGDTPTILLVPVPGTSTLIQIISSTEQQPPHV